jgi:hypothetical protein
VLLLNENALDSLLVFVVIEPNFKSPTVMLPSGIFLVVKYGFIKWRGYGFFLVDSLPRHSMIKLVEEL